MSIRNRRVRVLIVDDSAFARAILQRGLSSDPMIDVVGTARDAYDARDKIVNLKPDVLTLDVEMPRMDGVEFLRRLMPQHPVPVVMVSSLTGRGRQITLDALSYGAVDFVTKPSQNLSGGLDSMILELRTKVKIAATANVAHHKSLRAIHRPPGKGGNSALATSTDKVIAIGSSTGGVEALRVVLTAMYADTPGIVVVQHMPAGFTKSFADRLNQECAMVCKEAEDGDRVMAGRILIAPGDHHLEVVRSGGHYRVKLSQGPKVNGHRPSVSVMMHSVAKCAGSNASAAMLTGMGKDGADGMLAMRKAGAGTVAQDEATCVVYGMPKVAFEIGAAQVVRPIDKIAASLIAGLATPA